MSTFFIVGLVMGALLVSTIVTGFVISVLWGWFVAPTFGVPELSIPIAIGLAMVVSYFTYQHDAQSKEVDWGRTVGFLIARPIVALGFGWLVFQFV
ncbi:MAG: hypothetical protein AAF434_17335 [Pseudomonadota bacterium]